MGRDDFGLEDRVAVVTGATRGNGFAIAHRLASVGMHVVINSRHQEEADAVAKKIHKQSAKPALGVAADISDPTGAKKLYDAIDAWSDRPLEVLVNNAGYPLVPKWWSDPLHEYAPQELAKAIETVRRVDVDGSRWCTYEAIKRMKQARRGSIVFTSSTPALTGYQGIPYTEAKAAVLGLMRDVARAYGPFGIRANAIAPGNIRTEWLKHVSAAERERLEKENPLRRFGEPEEIADVVLFLASKMSGFVTGETIVVDGGTVMR